MNTHGSCLHFLKLLSINLLHIQDEIGMAIVWHGWVASIVGCTAIYGLVGAACVGATARIRALVKICILNGPLCKPGKDALD